MRRRIGFCVIDFMLVVFGVWFIAFFIAFVGVFVLRQLVTDETEKFLKEEHYKVFKEFKEEHEYFYGWIAYNFGFYGLHRRTFCVE